MTKLVDLSDLGEDGVVAVDSPHGKLAVGMSNGKPFAVSDRCRHLFASLGEGRVADDGGLECPRHAARYDVDSGKMTRGPQGALFAATRGAVKAGANAAAPLKCYPVVEHDGAIYLDS